MGRSIFDKLRVWAIHKLKGVVPEEVRLPETPQIKTYTATPEKVTAKMILHAGMEYSPAIVQQRLSHMLMDAVVDRGYVNFHVSENPTDYEHRTIRADILVIKKEQ